VDALAATSAVVPVIEVVDSRIREWAIEAGSTVADGVLAARVVHGDRIGNPAEGDRSLEGVVVRRNGERVATGVGADVMGGPFRVVSWLAGALADRGERLTAGDLVSTGSLTPLVPFEPGDTVEARFSSLGSVTVARPPVDSSR
jgi:2-keto-4-pentenoate hydratase